MGRFFGAAGGKGDGNKHGRPRKSRRETEGVMKYLSNAFSLQMQGENDCTARKCSLEEAKETVVNLAPGPYVDRESEKDGSDAIYKLTAKSCVGHADIATLLSKLIGYEVPVNRVSVALQPGDTLVVGQYVGPRLPEGCTTLPEGAKVAWYIVECRKKGSVARHDEMYDNLHNAAANLEWPDGERMLREVAKKYFPQFFDEHAFD